MTTGASVDASTVGGPASAPGPVPGGRRAARAGAAVARWWGRFSPTGLIGALLLFAAALGPSLMPRSPVYQGAIAGVCATVGYGAGTFVGWGARRVGLRAPWPPGRRTLVRRVAAGLAVVVVVWALLVDADWQARSRVLLDMGPPPPARPLSVLAVAAVLALLLVLAARGLRAAVRTVARLTGRLLPPVPARLVAVAVVGVAGFLLLDGTVVAAVRLALTTTYEARDEGTFPGDEQPTDPERSGSPTSLSAWDSLGREGRRFVSGGPTVEELARFSESVGLEREVREPVRVYAGLDSDADLDDLAAHVVAELDRTGAWERSVLVVTTTTGTGWVDPAAAAAIELLWGGDTTIAAMQYSYLPSWASFIGDRSTPPESGRALFEAVYARWSRLPPDDRPTLHPFGLSLGSFGSQGAFASLSDVAARTDGAVWAGTPGFTPLWARLTAARDAGSREVHPVLDGGRTVRWGVTVPDEDAASLADGDRTWQHPRVVYLQHTSDGVTWWSPDLLLDRPDWLREPRGADVLPDVGWFPVATFFRVGIDLVVSGEAPAGHGHTFVGEYADAWAAVAPPPGWSPAATAALRLELEAPRDTSVGDR